MRRRIILSIIVLILLGGVYWLFNHGFLIVNPDASSSNKTDYSVLNQGSGKGFSGSIDKPIKKLVGRSGYIVFAVQGEQSYFTTIHTKGFLQSTAVDIKVKPENSRKFIGNNPSSCMNLVANVLVSYTCGGTYNSLFVHEPASPQLPTYTKNNPGGFVQKIEGIANTSAGNFMVLKAAESVGITSPHVAYPIATAEAALSPNHDGSVPLNGLNDQADYVISSYKDGLLAHNQDYTQLAYFPAKSGSPSYINPTKPSKGVNIPVKFDNDQTTIAEIFTNNPSDNNQAKQAPGQKSELILTKDNSSKKFGIDVNVYGLQICGTNKVCLTSPAGLGVYDTSGKKLEKLFEFPGVTETIRTKGGLLARRDRVVWFVDADAQTGYAAYSLGNYQFNQFALAGNGALVVLTNGFGEKVALYIDVNQTNSNSIDKKVDKLRHSGSVKSVSTYDTIIYISPNYGDMVYVPSQQGFGYDPATVEKMNQAVKKDALSAGIDANKYIIRTPY